MLSSFRRGKPWPCVCVLVFSYFFLLFFLFYPFFISTVSHTLICMNSWTWRLCKTSLDGFNEVSCATRHWQPSKERKTEKEYHPVAERATENNEWGELQEKGERAAMPRPELWQNVVKTRDIYYIFVVFYPFSLSVSLSLIPNLKSRNHHVYLYKKPPLRYYMPCSSVALEHDDSTTAKPESGVKCSTAWLLSSKRPVLIVFCILNFTSCRSGTNVTLEFSRHSSMP